MADIQNRIASIGPRNSELLAVLARTDYAEASLQQQILYINDLEKEKASISKKIKSLEATTKIEKKEFDEYRESNFKRWTYKMGGKKGKDKFQTKTEKEERDYYEALEAERAAKDRLENVSRALEEAKQVHDNYKRDADEHGHAQRELDRLYEMIFDGATPDYPAEDQTEWIFTEARERFNYAEQQFRAVDQSVNILREAAKHMSVARQRMADARDASRMDIFGGGGAFADMAERNALQAAHSAVMQTETLVSQAMRINPAVKALGPMHVAQGNLMGDILFDNVFSDLDFHDKIKQSQAQIEQGAGRLLQQIKELEQNHGSLKSELDRQQEVLTQARKELQQMRSNIIAQTSSAQPPAYGSEAPAYST